MEVEYCLGIFTYNIGNAIGKFSEANVSLATLTDVGEVLDAAIALKRITAKQKEEILTALK